ncbi:MAG: hypothetical protein EA397_03755 [Deltaproteobacteria bacterium]|nr:MAG: hypothetical protein EA397_03755 [Deltaproteobacteria bacterium]
MNWPVLDLVRRNLGGVDLPTTLVLGLLVLGWGGTMVAVVFPSFWLERGHMKHGFGVFAITQFVPFMYTGENHFRINFLGEINEELRDDCKFSAEGYRNHVPVGAVYMASFRSVLALCSDESQIELRSTLREHEARSVWRVRRLDQGYELWQEP